ncbi:hypothetical protein ABK040_002202 [Willaertia magna]
MNTDDLLEFKNLLTNNTNHLEQAVQALKTQQKLFKTLFSQRKLPKKGFSDQQIENLLSQLSSLDSNNHTSHIGIGEREGRIYSPLVAKRHFYFCHGIGRSGELISNQPKAAGSSLILQLLNYLVEHSLQLAGCTSVKKVIVVPMCTGMTIALCLRTLYHSLNHTTNNLNLEKNNLQSTNNNTNLLNNNTNLIENNTNLNTNNQNKKYVLFCRIDQLSVLKSIQVAGFIPIIVENQLIQQQTNQTTNQLNCITTNLTDLEQKIQKYGPENILCVLSTTSCFAPRLPDNIYQISKLCKQYNIDHIINNAYGIQDPHIMKLLNKSINSNLCKVTCFIQSTDKNFMVPIGGAIIANGQDLNFIEKVSKMYAGRANMSPLLDLFITLLSMGEEGWLNVLERRNLLFNYFVKKIQVEVIEKFNNLVQENNVLQNDDKISIELIPSMNLESLNNNLNIIENDTIDNIVNNNTLLNHNNNNTLQNNTLQNNNNKKNTKKNKEKNNKIYNNISFAIALKNISKDKALLLGSKLFYKSCTGPRIVLKGSNENKKNILGIEFNGYGSHIDNYNYHYLHMACSIGISKEEIDLFCEMLLKLLKEVLLK